MAEAPVLTIPQPLPTPVLVDEVAHAQALARRYRCEFTDLKNFRIQHELFRSVPVDMMFRYNFVPLEQLEDRLVIAVSDPSKLMVLDEIAGLLGQRSAEEDRAVAARTRRGVGGADVCGLARRECRREYLDREADIGRGHQPHHPAGRDNHLYRARAACVGYSLRDLRRFSGC